MMVIQIHLSIEIYLLGQVPYLRYGLMVRHVINERSPVYNHTMDSLKQGDASFSLTVMGLERTSMQPVFHVEVGVFYLFIKFFLAFCLLSSMCLFFTPLYCGKLCQFC